MPLSITFDIISSRHSNLQVAGPFSFFIFSFFFSIGTDYNSTVSQLAYVTLKMFTPLIWPKPGINSS